MSPRKLQPAALRYAQALLLLLSVDTPKAKEPPKGKSLAQLLVEEPEWDTLTEEQQRAAIGDAAWEQQQRERS